MGLLDLFKKDKQSEDNLNKGMKKTSGKIGEGIAAVFLGRKTIDDELLEELEELLITADMGPAAADMIIEKVRSEYARGVLKDPSKIFIALKETVCSIFENAPRFEEVYSGQPYFILVLGVNGAGKTTSIAKLANMYKKAGKSVMLAAGDTFRAAAADQLAVWADRLSVPLIRQADGSDPAAVIHDAVQSAKAKNIDVLIADTAGRLHTKQNLMGELVKINKVAEKALGYPPNERLIVLDAVSGQNALQQAKTFNDAAGVTGAVITKLDGTAKGGIAVRVASELGIPIRYIGFGEGMDDMRPFDAAGFTDALFSGIKQEDI